MGEDPVRETAEGHANPAFVETVHGALARLRLAAPGAGSEDSMAFELAVVEVAGNSIEHARPAAGGGPVRLTLELESADCRLTARLCEHGALPAELPQESAALPHDLAESGRGLILARRLLTTLTLERARHTNTWTLTLRTETTRT